MSGAAAMATSARRGRRAVQQDQSRPGDVDRKRGAPNNGAQPVPTAERDAREIIAGELDFTLTVDRALKIVAVDAAGLKWAEVDDPAEVIGRSMLDFIAPAHRNAVRAAGELVFAGQLKRFQATPLTAKGNRRAVEAWVSVTTGRDGTPLAIGNVRDITDLIRAGCDRERALLAAIVESSNDAIFSVGPDCRVMSWNRGAERLLGVPAAEAIRQPMTNHAPPGLREWAAADIKRRLEDARSRRSGAEGARVRRTSAQGQRGRARRPQSR
jgi:PAS domain S-box-containing protein